MVDLDLSVGIFDGQWEKLAHVSYTNLSVAGVTHSGDLRCAPYPKGARETIEIDFKMLTDRYPGAKYVTMHVFSFSHQVC